MQHAFNVHHPKRAFTLVELLLVITIIVIVLALILVAVQSLQKSARATACLSNQRQIALANQSYAADNAGRLVSPRTNSYGYNVPGIGNMAPTRNPWVDNKDEGRAFVNGFRVETRAALEKGALWAYLSEAVGAYRSPLDPTDRLRSYSMNSAIGCGEKDPRLFLDDYWTFPNLEDSAISESVRGTPFNTATLARIPQPSRTFATLAEEDEGVAADGVEYRYNESGFSIRVQPPVGTAGEWIDTPATWNTGRVNISYMDGSVDAPAILYEELSLRFEQDRHNVVEYGSRPAFRFFAQIVLPGVIPPEIQ
ncbi:MAG: hypothetical protein RIT24_889 [Planctomycetota bacterium]|jgi:prepilin-type N-terminal cleavage/methylation domain-containing protein